MNKIFYIIFISLFSLTVISCSSSDDGASTTTDTTAPTVSSFYPTDNQTILISDNISVIFSESMDNTSVTTNTSNTSCSGSFQLSSDNFSSCILISSAPSISNSNKTFSIDPSDNLSLLTTYRIRVTTGVMDSFGNTMSSDNLTATGFTADSWKWTNDAAKYGCGESVSNKADTTRERLDLEHCWEHKIYLPYPSLPAFNSQYSEPKQEQIQQAQKLADKGWNKQVSSPAEYFVAKDVSEPGKSIVIAGIQLAESYLGNWGPLRVYIIGSDVDATKSLVQNFCNWSYQDSYVDYCVKQDQGVEIREIAIFKGSNAFAQHSRKLTNPTQAFVIGNPLQMGNDAGKVAVHEYVHIYTAAHQLYINADSFGGDWPIWLEEGAAEFLALYLSDQKGWLSFEKRMLEALDIARKLRSLVPGLTIADLEQDRDRVRKYCGLCMGQLQYETGQWATLWLAARTSIDVVFLEFFPSVYSMGLPQAFEKSFGLTIDQFHLEFEDFMASTSSEQLKLLTHMMYQ